MRTRHIIAIACIGLLTPAIASAQTQTAPTTPLSFSAIEQRLAADNFRILEIERYPTTIEVKGYDRNGVCTEMHLDPQNGAVLWRERDDDCSRSDRFDDSRGRGRGRDRH